MADLVGPGAHDAWPIPNCPPTCWPGAPLQRKPLCRTFSDCTTAPRNGMVSGCYPLDEFYKARPEGQRLVALKHPKAG